MGSTRMATYREGIRRAELQASGRSQFCTFADGHIVSFLSENIRQDSLKALTTRGPGKDSLAPYAQYGGEVVTDVD